MILIHDLVEIVEVGPRDGLQNELKKISVEEKIQLIDKLSKCGFDRIEVASFVSSKWVPQMADSDLVFKGLTRNDTISYSALTPNLMGLEKAILCQVNEVAIFASASESFSNANINCSIKESIERFVPLMKLAKEYSLPVRGYVSCVTDCPFEGLILPKSVQTVASRLLDLGCYEVSLGETLGGASQQQVEVLLESILKYIPTNKLAGHFHDTKEMALENIRVALDYGLRTFDSSVGGLGGCPYAPGASGNVATEAVVKLLKKLGYQTKLDEECINSVALFAKNLIKNKDIS
ncbi:MAG: hydroxymethylglutaryl-CoA lyase [Paracoccaceae bacterium]|nr:hydroxymethylglutaryl-CoA lyase [Paracoccaceae bacterium]